MDANFKIKKPPHQTVKPVFKARLLFQPIESCFAQQICTIRERNSCFCKIPGFYTNLFQKYMKIFLSISSNLSRNTNLYKLQAGTGYPKQWNVLTALSNRSYSLKD